MPEWSIGTGCKPVGLRPTEVRILHCPPKPQSTLATRGRHTKVDCFAPPFSSKPRSKLVIRLKIYQESTYNPLVKRCSGCKEEKDESQFQKNRTTHDGLQDQCKACRKATDRKSYLNRSPERTARVLEQQRKARARNLRLTYEYLLQHPCVDCGEADPVVLEFDHVRGEKRRNIADMIRTGRSWQTVYSEIGKCDVRCANCHRKITAKRFGWNKYSWYQENVPT